MQNYYFDDSQENVYRKKRPHCGAVDNDLINQTWMDLVRRPSSAPFENSISMKLMKALQEQQNKRQDLFGNNFNGTNRSMSSHYPTGNSVNYPQAQAKGCTQTPQELLQDKRDVFNHLQNINNGTNPDSSAFYNDESFINEERNRLLNLSKSLNGSKKIRYPEIESNNWGNSSRIPDYRNEHSTNVPQHRTENEAFQMLVDAADQRIINSVYPDDVKS